jgi:hypothetical protein
MASKALKELKRDYQALAELYLDTPEIMGRYPVSGVRGVAPQYQETAYFLEHARLHARPGQLTTHPEVPALWTTRDGATIPITEMDDDHLRNTVCFLQRKLVASFGMVRYIRDTSSTVKALHHMLAEAERRNLPV